MYIVQCTVTKILLSERSVDVEDQKIKRLFSTLNIKKTYFVPPYCTTVCTVVNTINSWRHFGGNTTFEGLTVI